MYVGFKNHTLIILQCNSKESLSATVPHEDPGDTWRNKTWFKIQQIKINLGSNCSYDVRQNINSLALPIHFAQSLCQVISTWKKESAYVCISECITHAPLGERTATQDWWLRTVFLMAFLIGTMMINWGLHRTPGVLITTQHDVPAHCVGDRYY